MMRLAPVLTAFAATLLASAQLVAADVNPVRTRPSADEQPAPARFIVKMREGADPSLHVQASRSGESAAPSADRSVSVAALKQRAQALADRAKLSLEDYRAISSRMHVMTLASTARGQTAEDMLASLRADAQVEYAVRDRRIYAHATSSDDPLAMVGQWYLKAASTTPSAINANGAWDVTTGSNGVVIAVLDTGVRFEHPDLERAVVSGRLLPSYDFVTPAKNANDQGGRDVDASDPGDWVEASDNCGAATPSSWHGTKVSGIIGALTNNGLGVAGITWKGYVLPVRVLGKCGGLNSDVVEGMRWAAGLSVPGVPDNPTPARIINVSLGSEGACDSASADVIREVTAAGVLVVVSAGNEGGPVDSPANCPGAMGILGLRHAGTKVGYSSLGPEIALGAPAGNCPDATGCTYSIDTTSNDGAKAPGNSIYLTQGDQNIGTSFSAPIVSGIAGLMLAVNGNLKSTQLIARMQSGAKPFPGSIDPTVPTCHAPSGASTDVQNAECKCTTAVCGAGMANAVGSVNEALRPIAAIAAPASFTAGADVVLQAGGSAAACGHTISAYQWTVAGTSGGATSPTIQNATTATATVQAPTTGTVTVRLIVTDEANKTDSATVTLSSTSSTSGAPSAAGNTACLADVAIPPETPLVSVDATDANAAEPGTNTGTFTFTRSADSSAPLTISVLVSGTATNGADYQAIGNTVTFAAGSPTATLTVTPIDNSVVNSARTVVVTIQSGSGYSVGPPSTATVNIADDGDVAPPPSSGGGGGTLDELTLLWLALASLAALVRRRQSLQR